ncbi:hypothetical protein [Bacillus marinisedimentorum]|uniref:hypothetical protein n=1 Tax=Bacillus marinisedimentorum TaxID=1821260 RepID=UPI000872B023|nr:hypothetical protein [Bacillus marinisedimentorum]
MVRYHILYTWKQAAQIYIAVLDFHKGAIVTYSIDDLDTGELEPELQRYSRKLAEKIKSGYWDYTQLGSKRQ